MLNSVNNAVTLPIVIYSKETGAMRPSWRRPEIHLLPESPKRQETNESQAAFEQGKPVLPGFAMKINWATVEREWISSKRMEEIEKRNIVIDAMNYLDEVQYSVNNSDNPAVIYRQLFGGYPHPWIEGRKGYYRPPRPENE